MAKISGLGVRLYAGGIDLNADVSALQGLGYTNQLLEVPNLAVGAMERIVGLTDGKITVNGWFNAAGAHAQWTVNSGKLPTVDVVAVVGFGTALGDAMAGLVAKQASYDVSRQPGSAIATTCGFEANGYGLEFGVLHSTGPKQTDASATTSSNVNNGASSANGAAGYLQIISLGSGTPTIKIQHSVDGATSWADLITWTINSAGTAERVAAAGTVRQYTRLVTTGTFTDLVIVAGLSRG